MDHRILLLAGDGDSSRIVCHALRDQFGSVTTVVEDQASRARLLKRRVRRLGWVTVFGQVLFVVVLVRLLRSAARKRIATIVDEHGLDVAPLPSDILRVPSVNSPEVRSLIQELKPNVVVVNGTRIIGPDTLAEIKVPIINTHAGITPRYRGAHGAYWALRDGRVDLVGTTIHFIDEGVDTGQVIDQAYFHVTPEDSFASYPYLHIAHGLPLLIEAVRRALDGTLETMDDPPSLPSALHTHPTFWGYLRARFSEGVK